MFDDNLLMEMVQEGNKEAFEQLVSEHRVAAIEFANHLVLNYHTAEDILLMKPPADAEGYGEKQAEILLWYLFFTIF